MVRDNLIDTILRAALEETGAQRGLLILSSSGENRVVAEAGRRQGRITVIVRDEGVAESLLPKTVLDSIRRNRRSVVIDDAVAQATAPGYRVRQHKAGSMLFLPLLHRAKPVGVLLLE